MSESDRTPPRERPSLSHSESPEPPALTKEKKSRQASHATHIVIQNPDSTIQYAHDSAAASPAIISQAQAIPPSQQQGGSGAGGAGGGGGGGGAQGTFVIAMAAPRGYYPGAGYPPQGNMMMGYPQYIIPQGGIMYGAPQNVRITESEIAAYTLEVEKVRRTHLPVFIVCLLLAVTGICLAIFSRSEAVSFAGWSLSVFMTILSLVASISMRQKIRRLQLQLASGFFQTHSAPF